MSELRALMREDDDTASTGSEDPDAEDRATVTTVTIGDLDIVTQEATHARRERRDQSGNVCGAPRAGPRGAHWRRALRGPRRSVELACGCAVPAGRGGGRGAARVVATDASPSLGRRGADGVVE